MIPRAKVIEAAEELLRAGRYREAAEQYAKLLDGGANDVSVNALIGDLQLKSGRRDEALKIFRTNLAVLDERGAFAQALAVAKKIHKLDPGDGEIRERMGDLYGRLGFPAEARAEYAEAARLFQERKDVHGRISVYGKLARLDRTDFGTRLKLARLLALERQTAPAVAELGAVADVMAARGDDAGAEKVLREALGLDPGDIRAVTGLFRILRKRGRPDQAAALLAAVPGGVNRPDLLLLLGDLHAEGGEAGKARECFARVLARDPESAEARVRLGRLEAAAGRPDLAFSTLEPLVIQAIHKKRDDRAISLLGLILMTGPLHLPSLEKLASIYRATNRATELEIADRLLAREYRARGLDVERERELSEVATHTPHAEAAAGRKLPARDHPDPEGPSEPAPPEPALGPEGEELVRASLAKADKHLAEGMTRNACRILENLQQLFPGDPRIGGRLEAARAREKTSEDVDIPLLLRRFLSLESESQDEGDEEEPSAPPQAAAPFPRTVSLEEIFGAADLTAAPPSRGGARPVDYPDLSDKIREERKAMEQALAAQAKARSGPAEKGLTEIVVDFRRRVEQRIAQRSIDARYNLGLAFMEQGLLDEAVDEFEQAAEDPGLAPDAMALIGQCFRRKGAFKEAAAWVERALGLAAPGSGAELALTYDLAQLREDMDLAPQALALYREVAARSPRYRDTALRIHVLASAVP